MWLYLPKSCLPSPSAPAAECSTLESESLSLALAPSVTWNGNSPRPASWSRYQACTVCGWTREPDVALTRKLIAENADTPQRRERFCRGVRL